MFVSAALLTAIAVLNRRALASYVGGLILFLGSLITAEELVEQSAFREVAVLIEPFGFLAVREMIMYWTPFERNAQLIELEGVLLWNRLIWISGAICLLSFLYFRFRFGHEAEQVRKNHKTTQTTQAELPVRATSLVIPHVEQTFTLGIRMHQLLFVLKRSFSEIFSNRLILFILFASIAFIFINGWDAWIVFDTPTWPVTYVVARNVLGQMPPLIYILIAIFAGELIWREREAGMSEITDAIPMPDWVAVLGKFGALLLAIIALQAVLMASGIALQAALEYYNFEPLLYIKILFGIQLPDYVLWAVLAFMVYVLVDQKYIGHLIFIIYYALTIFGRSFLEIEHNMLLYPAAPSWNYSDMSGFAPFLAPYLWFKLYWAAWALLLMVLASLFWRRGRESSFKSRLQEARVRFSGQTALVTSGAGVFLLLVGSYVFYNTNILNKYLSKDDQIARMTAYERLYKKYEKAPQPSIGGSSYLVEIYPENLSVELRGNYLLLNKTATPIDSIHLVVDPKIVTRAIQLNQENERALWDKVHGYYIFELKNALAPGDSLQLSYELAFEPHGFSNYGAVSIIVSNGTLLDFEQLPMLGYQPDRELKSGEDREEQGLPPRAPMPSVYDKIAQNTTPRYGEWTHTKTVIGTSKNQLAVAPGSLHRTWMENGRRYFHYETTVPVKNVQAFFSADYDVLEDSWKGVKVQIFHHPTHTYNLKSMVQGVKASLDYYTQHFGSYPYKQLRIVEFPRHEGSYARAFPNTVGYSEGLGFLARVDDGINYPFTVTAHEVAHQWWGGMFAAADVQGKRVLHETLAHYSALMVMEKAYGAAEVRKFLSQFMHRYMVGRQNRGHLEVPLLLSENQDYIHYDKGAVVMYALKEYIGEEKINTALRRFLEKHSYSKAPYPTTLDLLEELRTVTPDSMQYMLTDLFEEITIWDMRTKVAQVEPTGKGDYRVTLEVEGTKMKADSIGRAQEVPMHDYVEIGVFAAADEEEGLGKKLYLQKHRIRSGSQKITITVPQAPSRAGIDPYHNLIEWTREDNVVDVEKINK